MTEQERKKAVTAMEAILSLSEQVTAIASRVLGGADRGKANIAKARAAQEALRQFTEPPERTQG